MIWWGGHIEEQDDTRFTCLATGLHCWKNIAKLSETLDDELTHNWWMVRRFVAWAAKTPDSRLPPIQREKTTKEIRSFLMKQVFWDGSLINQMEHI
jgi:hypothetical protein